MSLISPSRCLPAALIFWRSGQERLLAEVLGLLLEHLGVADDGVERRPQLVAHVRQELRLVLAGLFELAVRLLELLEQAGVLDGDARPGRRTSRAARSTVGGTAGRLRATSTRAPTTRSLAQQRDGDATARHAIVERARATAAAITRRAAILDVRTWMRCCAVRRSLAPVAPMLG